MSVSRRVVTVFAVVLVLITLSSFTARHSGPSYTTLTSSSYNQEDPTALRRKIWQTSMNSSKDVDQPLLENVVLWHSRNLGAWEYEMLTDEECDRYVERRYKAEPEIVEIFTGLEDKIIRADLFRYLVLLADGGVYSDMDTECLKPIDEWVPARYKNQTNIVLGVEYDTLGGDRGMALLDLQLANWTLLSKKGHPLLRLTVKRALEAIAALARSQNVLPIRIKATFNDVLAIAGPVQLTTTTWEYLSGLLGEDFGWKNVTGIQEPKLVGDVLLMPVTSFGNGQMHSYSKPKTDKDALVHHQFAGTWKTDGHAYSNMKAKGQDHAAEG